MTSNARIAGYMHKIQQEVIGIQAGVERIIKICNSAPAELRMTLWNEAIQSLPTFFSNRVPALIDPNSNVILTGQNNPALANLRRASAEEEEERRSRFRFNPNAEEFVMPTTPAPRRFNPNAPEFTMGGKRKRAGRKTRRTRK